MRSFPVISLIFFLIFGYSFLKAVKSDIGIYETVARRTNLIQVALVPVVLVCLIGIYGLLKSVLGIYETAARRLKLIAKALVPVVLVCLIGIYDLLKSGLGIYETAARRLKLTAKALVPVVLVCLNGIYSLLMSGLGIYDTAAKRLKMIAKALVPVVLLCLLGIQSLLKIALTTHRHEKRVCPFTIEISICFCCIILVLLNYFLRYSGERFTTRPLWLHVVMNLILIPTAIFAVMLKKYTLSLLV